MSWDVHDWHQPQTSSYILRLFAAPLLYVDAYPTLTLTNLHCLDKTDRSIGLELAIHWRSHFHASAYIGIRLHSLSRREESEMDLLYCFDPRTTGAVRHATLHACRGRWLGCCESPVYRACCCASPRLPHPDLAYIWRWTKPIAHATLRPKDVRD